MELPGFQTFILPVLKLLRNGKEYHRREIYEAIAIEFNISDEELQKILPSGKQTVFTNRVGWSITYLKKAKLLESSTRGKFRITDSGLDVLKREPTHIDIKYLQQFPDFIEFQKTSQPNDEEKKDEPVTKTPEEIIEEGYQSLKSALAEELLERITKCTPNFFEQLVIDLLLAMGYGGSRTDAGQAVGQSGDGGIDGIIKEDRLGLDAVYIQAKRWTGTVGRPVVQAFAGALMGKKANKGVLITTSNFSQEAKDYVNTISQKIVLIDGKELAEYMIDYNVGVAEVGKYILKKMDMDYFEGD